MEAHWSLLAMYALAVIIEIGLPITLAVWITKKWKVSWLVILTGVLTFIGSQVVHLPILSIPGWLSKAGVNITLPQNWPVIYYAIYLGLLAGLCEETARWVGYKALKSRTNSYKTAFGLGIGHGGIESVFVGIVVVANVLTLVFMNPATLAAQGVSADIVQQYTAKIQEFWATPWHLPLAGAVERITAISAQLFMSVLVWKAVTQRNWLWYALAVGYHALLDGVSVYLGMATKLNSWQFEAILLVFLAIDIFFLIVFWRKEKEKEKLLTLEVQTDAPPVLPVQ